MASNPEEGRIPPYGPVIKKRLEREGVKSALEMRNFSHTFQDVEEVCCILNELSESLDTFELSRDVCAYGSLNFLLGSDYVPLSMVKILENPDNLQKFVDESISDLDFNVETPTTSYEFVQLLLEEETVGSLVAIHNDFSGMLHLVSLKHIPDLDGDISAQIGNEKPSEFFVLIDVDSKNNNHVFILEENDVYDLFARSGYMDDYTRSILVFKHKKEDII